MGGNHRCLDSGGISRSRGGRRCLSSRDLSLDKDEVARHKTQVFVWEKTAAKNGHKQNEGGWKQGIVVYSEADQGEAPPVNISGEIANKNFDVLQLNMTKEDPPRRKHLKPGSHRNKFSKNLGIPLSQPRCAPKGQKGGKRMGFVTRCKFKRCLKDTPLSNNNNPFIQKVSLYPYTAAWCPWVKRKEEDTSTGGARCHSPDCLI